MPARMTIEVERFPIAGRFTIARGAKTEAVVVTVRIEKNRHTGWGESVPYSRYGESVEGVVETIERIRSAVETKVSREELQELLPPGAARNAVDCALWDLEAKETGVPAWKKAGLAPLKPVVTAYTISLDTPEVMESATRKASERPVLKIKLGASEGDAERIERVRRAAPQASLIVDANEGWTERNIEEHFQACEKASVSLIEQPVASDRDEILRDIEKPVPLCADESVHDRASLERLVGLYDFINVKLDKTGGLTEALALVAAAEKLKLGLMVGCMVGTSLAMAPALLLASKARFVDLDGPLLLARDRENGLVFEGSVIQPPSQGLWGI